MSVQAIVWVLERAPDLPSHLVAPLLGLANHADQDGRGAYASTETIGWYTRKKRDAARVDLDKLEGLGLIRRGDQRMALHLPADRRPVVYDLAMERSREPRPDRHPSGQSRVKALVNGTPATGGVHDPPRSVARDRGGLQTGPGGSTAATGGVHRPPEPSLEPPLNQKNPPPHASVGSLTPNSQDPQPPPRACGRVHPDTTACRACGTNPRAVVAAAEAARRAAQRPCPDHQGQVAGACGLCRAEQYAPAPAELSVPRPAEPVQLGPKLPWCGECERVTRWVLAPVGPGHPCPTCRPEQAAAALVGSTL